MTSYQPPELPTERPPNVVQLGYIKNFKPQKYNSAPAPYDRLGNNPKSAMDRIKEVAKKASQNRQARDFANRFIRTGMNKLIRSMCG